MIRYQDLPATDRHRRAIAKAGGGTINYKGRPLVLRCVRCLESFSASRGDYFMQRQDDVIKHCGRPMELIQELACTARVLTPEQARNLVQFGE